MAPRHDGTGVRLLSGTTTRAMEITTPLDPDVLLFHRMRGREALGRLSDYRVSLLSRHDVDLDQLLGKPVSIKAALAGDRVREFNGYVTQISQHGTRGRYNRYTATVSPWLWFLTRTSDCRVFTEMTVREIVDAVFANHEADHVWALTGEYPKREYCVQYRETDFNFVSRLLEQEGIYYYFKHHEGRAVMVLTDSSSHHEASYATGLPFIPPGRIGGRNDVEHVSTWRLSRRVQPGAYAHRDYDFERPAVDLLTRAAAPRPHQQSHHERFDYPGGYVRRQDGERYAAMRMEEYSSRFETARAATNAREVAAGYRLRLARHPREDQNREYLVTSATYDLEFSDYEALPDRGGAAYRCCFDALSTERQFRPRRLTRTPVVRGVQTALVVGRPGHEIDTDPFGRIRIQFHWDRYGERNEHSSCWVRVSQFWAGHHFGALFTPRVGQEVIVGFLEGDPDRPIVVSGVYNGQQKTPYNLPAHKTRSGVKTRSTPDGAAHQGNELRFEDKKGSEQVFVHAERNQDNRVKNDSLEWVGNNRHLIVTGDQFEQVGGDKHLTVKGDQNEKVDGTVSLQAGMDLQQKVGMKHGLDAGLEIHLKAGMNVVVEAGVQLTLKVGGNFIHLNPAGVFIQGTMVLINSGGAAGTGSGCSPAPPTLPGEADRTESSTSPQVATGPGTNPQATVLRQAAVTGTPFCEKCVEAGSTRDAAPGQEQRP